ATRSGASIPTGSAPQWRRLCVDRGCSRVSEQDAAPRSVLVIPRAPGVLRAVAGSQSTPRPARSTRRNPMTLRHIVSWKFAGETRDERDAQAARAVDLIEPLRERVASVRALTLHRN